LDKTADVMFSPLEGKWLSPEEIQILCFLKGRDIE